MDTMNRHFFSKTHRGFTIQQTDLGWVIVNCPNWCHSGPVPDGPFATDGIARHVIDNILDDPNERVKQEQKERERTKREEETREELAERREYRQKESSGFRRNRSSDRLTFADKLEFFIGDLVNYAFVAGVGIWLVLFIFDEVSRLFK